MMTLWLRYLAALYYDAVVVLALFMVFSSFVVLWRGGHALPPNTYWFQVSLMGILYLYYATSLGVSGQTIGLRAWRLMIESPSGRVSQGQVLARFFLILPAMFFSVVRAKSPLLLLGAWSQTRIE